MTVQDKTTYVSPKRGRPLLKAISSGCRTPKLKVYRFCNLLEPYFYNNSKSIPRYSVCCLLDPKVDKEFIKEIQTIEKSQGVETILKVETEKKDGEYCQTGKVVIKFQRNEEIPIYRIDPEEGEIKVTLQDELDEGEIIEVVYDIMSYTKKNTMKTEHGISLKPSKIYLYPQD